MPTLNSQEPIAARDWAAIARATQQRERAEHGPGELWYDDRHLQETAISSARAQCTRAISAAVDAGACTDEIVDAVLAGAPTLDHYEAAERVDDVRETPARLAALFAHLIDAGRGGV